MKKDNQGGNAPKTPEAPKKVYENFRTDDGLLLGARYTYNGKVYIQTELPARALQELTELFISLDLPITDFFETFNLQVGQIISAVVKNKALTRVLSIILTREDGNAIDGDFDKGKALELYALLGDVISDFFSLNVALGELMKSYLLRLRDVIMKKIAGLNPDSIRKYLASAMETLPKSGT